MIWPGFWQESNREGKMKKSIILALLAIGLSASCLVYIPPEDSQPPIRLKTIITLNHLMQAEK